MTVITHTWNQMARRVGELGIDNLTRSPIRILGRWIAEFKEQGE